MRQSRTGQRVADDASGSRAECHYVTAQLSSVLHLHPTQDRVPNLNTPIKWILSTLPEIQRQDRTFVSNATISVYLGLGSRY